MFFRIVIKLTGYNLKKTLFYFVELQLCDHFFTDGFKSATCLPVGLDFF